MKSSISKKCLVNCVGMLKYFSMKANYFQELKLKIILFRFILPTEEIHDSHIHDLTYTSKVENVEIRNRMSYG